MDVPGRLGHSVFGDESIEFVRSPRDYIEKRRKSHGEVFVGRLLNKPHIFLTSNAAIQELLIDKWSNFSMAYKEMVFELFEENLVFLEGDAWTDMRRPLEMIFSHDSITHNMDIIKHIIGDHVKKIKTHEPIVVYEALKELVTRLSITLFLDDDIGEDDAKKISKLLTAHWRGIISIPLPIRVPWMSWRSGYSKAITAKDRLLEIIKEKLISNPTNMASRGCTGVTDRETLARNILLFVSALIPKALASLLTSTIIELAKDENKMWRRVIEDELKLDHVILEVQRLWPPFYGGRRMCEKSCMIGGYLIPKGHLVGYVSYSANRDRTVFTQPDKFKPERWSLENANDVDKVWTFGGGARQCIGMLLSNTILKTLINQPRHNPNGISCVEYIRQVHMHYTWEVVPGQDLSYKVLPVSRPKDDIQVVFTKLS